MSNAPAPVQAAAAEMFQNVVDSLAAQQQIRNQALADAWDTPMPSVTRNVTNNFTSTTAPAPATQPPSQTTPAPGLSGLAKAGIVAGALASGGGLLAGGALLSNWLNPSTNSTAVVQPTTPAGQVSIGINPDGTLFDPTKAGTSP